MSVETREEADSVNGIPCESGQKWFVNTGILRILPKSLSAYELSWGKEYTLTS